MAKKSNGMIIRDKLLCLFEQYADEKYIFVCAPAGYGKTVAVRQWLDKKNTRRAVIALDEYDNNMGRFCEHFCAALRDCQPQNAALAEMVSHAAFSGAPDEFALRAIAALSGRKHITLVIDDLHFIHDQQVLDFLLLILKRLPQTFQTILISRSELPAGFADLWAKGNLIRISTEQFNFSSEEIMRLYHKRGNQLTPEQAGNICRLTDGWAIGVNALLLSGGSLADSNPTGESFEYLEEFIRANIWEKWDEAKREFMLATAIARELDPSLCNVLYAVENSEKMLRDLMISGAFIFQTSDGIYHYHHLFHSFLRRMLAERGQDYLYSLLEKEGQWHLGRQDFYRAAECFIQCKNHDGIAKCFDLLEITDRNEFIIEKMLQIIKNPEINQAANKYPFLYYMMAWAAFAEGRFLDMTTYMDAYYLRFPEIAARDPAHAHNIFFMRFIDFRASLYGLKAEMTALPITPNTDGVRGSVSMNMPLLHRSIRDFSELACENTEAVIMELASMAGWLFGEETNLLISCLAAGLLYEQGHLEKAHTYAMAANAEIKEGFSPEMKFCAIAILAYILDAMSEGYAAEQALSRAQAMIETDRAYYLNRNLRALLTRRKLAKGQIEAAVSWLSSSETTPFNNLNCFGMYSAFTTSRAYITAGNYDLAIILLTKILDIVKSYNRPLGTIEAHILLAIAFWQKKRSFLEEALRNLESAVLIAHRYGYTQMFANESAELAPMLQRLQKKAEQPGQEQLPAAFIESLYNIALENQNTGLISGKDEQTPKFTDKQKTVMKLLCEGKSYREISELMGKKIPTIRSHVSLIYKKLDVTCETDAIMKIKSLNVLSEM